jgi:predicted phosphodiesterase
VLLVHASPGQDDGVGIQDFMTDSDLTELGVCNAAAELIFVGHTHRPLDRSLNGVRVVNLGSVSVPATDDRRAMWALLTADRHGYTIERRQAVYDLAEVRRDVDHQHHPSAAWLKGKFRDQP